MSSSQLPQEATNSDSDSMESSSKSSLTARILSGSMGSVVTSLLVTPLDVVKVRLQAAAVAPLTTTSRPPPFYVPCPGGCGTFVLYNGHMDCVLPRSVAPYFDSVTGQLTAGARQCLLGTTTSTLPSTTSTLTTSPSKRITYTSSAATAASPSTTPSTAAASSLKTPNTFVLLRRIFAKEGFAGIYAGLRPTLVMAVPNTVLYYSAYDEIVWHLRKSRQSEQRSDRLDANAVLQGLPDWMIPLLAGGSARMLASLVTAPLELVRTRQAAAVASKGARTSMQQELRAAMRQGVGGLYRGLGASLWRDVPFSAIYWASLEGLKQYETRQLFTESPSPLQEFGQAFFNGAVSGMIAAFCTTPFDVVKTRQQAMQLEFKSSPTVVPQATTTAAVCQHDGMAVLESRHSIAKPGVFGQLRHILATEGVAGLWRGNQARIIKVAPACAIMISSYEMGKRFLDPNL